MQRAESITIIVVLRYRFSRTVFFFFLSFSFPVDSGKTRIRTVHVRDRSCTWLHLFLNRTPVINPNGCRGRQTFVGGRRFRRANDNGANTPGGGRRPWSTAIWHRPDPHALRIASDIFIRKTRLNQLTFGRFYTHLRWLKSIGEGARGGFTDSSSY